MAPKLVVNGRDITSILRLQHDQGFDPQDAEFLAPMFSGAPALSEGGAFVAETARNKQWKVPIIASAANPGLLDGLQDDLNNDLFRGAVVEFQADGATQSTFFDLEAGRYDWTYENFMHRANHSRGTLNLWTRPYGNTGTTRTIVASQAATAILGPGNYLASGIQGDARALGNIYIGQPSTTTPQFAMYAVTPNPSYVPFYNSNLMSNGGGFVATDVANGAVIASSWRQWNAAPSRLADGFFLLALDPSRYAGRNRIFALVGHSFTGSTTATNPRLWLSRDDATGAGANPTPVNSVVSSIATTVASGKFGLLDLGEVTVPSQYPGAAPAATQGFRINYSVAAPTYTASYALRINGVVVVPLDYAAAIVPSYRANLALRAYPLREAFVNVDGGFGPSAVAQYGVDSVVRGETPRLPQATQMRVMTWAGQINSFNPVATHTVQFDARERFQFLR